MRKDTIFRPSFGNRPERIVGRDKVLSDFVEGIGSYPGSRERSRLILGQRGMGKTSLLIEMGRMAQGLGYLPVRVTMRDEILNDIIELLDEGLQAHEAQLPRASGMSAGALGFSVGVDFPAPSAPTGFRTRLSRLTRRADRAGLGLLFLLDEVIPNESMRTFATTYQELVGDGANIAVVMAGLPGSVSRVLNAEGLTFLNRAERTAIGPLAIPDVSSYLADSFGRLGIKTEKHLPHEAAEATEGLPYLMQLIGHNLVISSTNVALGSHDLSEAKARALDDLKRNVFEATLRPLSDGDRAFLRAMSNDMGPSRVSDIRERLGTTPGQVQTYRARLLEAGVIDSPRHGELAFAMPYFGDYLAGRV